MCDALVLGARRGKAKGWHRRTLRLGNKRYFNDAKEKQLHTELVLLRQHLNESGVVKENKEERIRYKKQVNSEQ